MLEDLLKVVGHLVVGEAAITHDEIVGMLFGNLGDGGFVDFLIEAGQEIGVCYVPDGFACNLRALNLGREFNAEVYHGLEEQILLRAVALDIVLK